MELFQLPSLHIPSHRDEGGAEVIKPTRSVRVEILKRVGGMEWGGGGGVKRENQRGGRESE